MLPVDLYKPLVPNCSKKPHGKIQQYSVKVVRIANKDVFVMLKHPAALLVIAQVEPVLVSIWIPISICPPTTEM